MAARHHTTLRPSAFRQINTPNKLNSTHLHVSHLGDAVIQSDSQLVSEYTCFNTTTLTTVSFSGEAGFSGECGEMQCGEGDRKSCVEYTSKTGNTKYK